VAGVVAEAVATLVVGAAVVATMAVGGAVVGGKFVLVAAWVVGLIVAGRVATAVVAGGTLVVGALVAALVTTVALAVLTVPESGCVAGPILTVAALVAALVVVAFVAMTTAALGVTTPGVGVESERVSVRTIPNVRANTRVTIVAMAAITSLPISRRGMSNPFRAQSRLERHRKLERAADPDTALYPDPPTVRLDECSRNREANSGIA
jgi:hypothetical protein